MVRTVAASADRRPDSSWVRVTRGSIDRWMHTYLERRLEAANDHIVFVVAGRRDRL